MTAVSLFDLLARAGRGTPPAHLGHLAEKLVNASLADLKRVREYEAEFGPSEYDEQGIAVARSIDELYRQWLSEAEEILVRVKKASGELAGPLELLEDATGSVRARLALSMGQVQESLGQIKAGLGVPMQNLRNELRSRIRA